MEPGMWWALFGGGPAKQGPKRLPVPIQIRLQRHNPVVVLAGRWKQLPQVGQRGFVGLPVLGQPLAIFGIPGAHGVQQVIAHKNAGQMHVGP